MSNDYRPETGSLLAKLFCVAWWKSIIVGAAFYILFAFAIIPFLEVVPIFQGEPIFKRAAFILKPYVIFIWLPFLLVALASFLRETFYGECKKN